MFTGIIKTIGKVRAIHAVPGGIRLSIDARNLVAELQKSDSIAVDGCCLTVEHKELDVFQVYASKETLERTTLGLFRSGDRVNLEPALTVGDRLGGHFVTGHVDGKGEIVSITTTGDSRVFRFSVPAEFHKLLAKKGSIAVDGISLTVADVERDVFSVVIIPLSFESTTLQWKKTGDRVNLEFDLIAKYVIRLLEPQMGKSESLSLDLLTRTGFIK